MNIYQQLLRSQTYQQVFDDYQQKLDNKYLPIQVANSDRLQQLSWILNNRKKVLRELIPYLRKNHYQVDAVTASWIKLDKLRILYLLQPLDKLLESTCAKLIQTAIAKDLSPRLFSYQKGRGAWTLLADLGKHLAIAAEANQQLYIIKTDFKSFGDSIQLELLLSKLRFALPNQEDRFWKLLESLLKPTIIATTGVTEEDFTTGLPAGFALTPVLENFYCSDIDNFFTEKMKQNSALLYSRFGDDIIMVADSESQIQQAYQELATQSANSGLTLNKEKEAWLTINHQNNLKSSPFKKVSKFDHLGSSISATGRFFLSEQKLTKVKKHFKQTIAMAAQQHRHLRQQRHEFIKILVASANLLLDPKLLHPYLLQIGVAHADPSRLKAFDKWVAKSILSEIFHSKSDRVFRYCSYDTLRNYGLRSLTQLMYHHHR